MQTSATDGNVTQATFLRFIDEYSDVDQAVAQAVGMRKDLRKRIKGAGLNLAAFDRSRVEADKSAEKREEEDREFRRNLAWLGKPIGHQADMFGGAPPPAAGAPPANGEDSSGDAISEHQLHQVERAGRQAGEAGHDRAMNPWAPGSFLYQRWDAAWLAGQEALARRGEPAEAPIAGAAGEGAGDPASAAPGASDAPEKRGRGRPPGARNKPKAATTAPRRNRGRPAAPSTAH